MPFLPKTGFGVKSAQTLKLASKNCVLLLFELDTGFCQILSLLCKKMRFASILVEKIQLTPENGVLLQFVLETGFCQILSVSPHNVCYEFAQGIQDALNNCV